ncbi:MAG: hypothetical protein V2J10_09975, partial [Wenzhouxiangella sp.]|nr:hypothetical protein [Wenzhouxiangella sp.]
GQGEVLGAEHAEEFLKLATHAEHIDLSDEPKGSGKKAVADSPDRFLSAIAPFLKKQASKGAAA